MPSWCFLRHLEKTSHHFLAKNRCFNPSRPFSAKKGKKRQKNHIEGKCLFFFLYMKILFCPFLSFFACFCLFFLFGLWCCFYLSNYLGITSKVEESHILHGQKDVTLEFFSPLGPQLQPSLRSCVKTTLGETLLPEEKKKFSVTSFFHRGKRHFCLILDHPLESSEASLWTPTNFIYRINDTTY